jgi:hypothetical protein
MKFTGYSRRMGTGPGRNGWSRLAAGHEPPLRSELFSADQMAQHGPMLARSHRLASGPAPDRLLDRLAANETALVGVCNLLTTAVSQGRQITPAGEWLLDNFYLVEEQIRTARRHLPEGYIRELPHLAQAAGHPRVYDIALETIAHGDGRVDARSLARSAASWRLTKPSPRCGLASCGRSRSCCGWR